MVPDPGAGVFREQDGVHAPLPQEERGGGPLEGPEALHDVGRQGDHVSFFFACVVFEFVCCVCLCFFSEYVYL